MFETYYSSMMVRIIISINRFMFSSKRAFRREVLVAFKIADWLSEKMGKAILQCSERSEFVP